MVSINSDRFKLWYLTTSINLLRNCPEISLKYPWSNLEIHLIFYTPTHHFSFDWWLQEHICSEIPFIRCPERHCCSLYDTSLLFEGNRLWSSFTGFKNQKQYLRSHFSFFPPLAYTYIHKLTFVSFFLFFLWSFP